jgi:hypothetical protein
MDSDKRNALGVHSSARSVALLAAPLMATTAGLMSHWWDPRQALLLPMGLAVLATAWAMSSGRHGWFLFFLSVGVGAAAWGFAQTVYVCAHALAGEPFDAERFGPQGAQAIGLIAAHALFLGVPTGAVAGLLLNLPPLRSSSLATD